MVIGPRESLLGRGVVARETNWLGPSPQVGQRVTLQIRHRAPASPAEIIRLDGNEVELALDEPVAAITPGQSLVLYEADRVVGGGVIERAGHARLALPVLAA